MNNITSPRTDDQGIEHLIQAKGLDAARVTPEDINSEIVSCYFFTAEDGVNAEEFINMRPRRTYEGSLSLLTFCVLVLRNGFTVTGESACASPENFDIEVGQKIAYENAKQKLWPLLGYLLKQKLYEGTQ